MLGNYLGTTREDKESDLEKSFRWCLWLGLERHAKRLLDAGAGIDITVDDKSVLFQDAKKNANYWYQSRLSCRAGVYARFMDVDGTADLGEAI